MTRELPDKHPLSYYAVLGALTGAYVMLGNDYDSAQAKAVERLKDCKPPRPAFRRKSKIRRERRSPNKNVGGVR